MRHRRELPVDQVAVVAELVRLRPSWVELAPTLVADFFAGRFLPAYQRVLVRQAIDLVHMQVTQ